MKVRRIHYLSGLTITVFIGFHLLNHFISIFGAEQHIEWMTIFRKVYRNPLIETLLLFAVFAQIISGVKLYFSKRKIANIFFVKLQVWTGLYLAFFLLMHVSAVMVGRFILDLDTNFYFGVAGLNTFPFLLFFVPYYGLAIIAFFGHVAAIHSQKMKKSFWGLSPDRQSKVILYTGLALTLVILYGLTGGFTGIEIPATYDVMIGK